MYTVCMCRCSVNIISPHYKINKASGDLKNGTALYCLIFQAFFTYGFDKKWLGSPGKIYKDVACAKSQRVGNLNKNLYRRYKTLKSLRSYSAFKRKERVKTHRQFVSLCVYTRPFCIRNIYHCYITSYKEYTYSVVHSVEFSYVQLDPDPILHIMQFF